MPPRTVYVFGNGRLAFDEFVGLYVPAMHAALSAPDTSWAVCDFRGVDTLAMEYLKTRTAAVTVLHVGERPRYLPDRAGAHVATWALRGGFADDDARDAAALDACTHFLAFDRASTPSRTSGTGRIIARCLAAGRAPLATDDREARVARAHAEIDRHDVHPTARAFAHTLVELFPPWFDFAPERFAVLRGSLGLHLVASGPTQNRGAEVLLITTSDSRNMFCAVHSSHQANGEVATISMHYTPSEEHRERARAAIERGLRRLFPLANG